MDNMKNPYKGNKNDETNNETKTKNIVYQSVEKEVFNSQLSIVSQEDEKNTNQMNISIPFSSSNDGNSDFNNNNNLKFNHSSIMMQDNNEYNNESNKNSCNLNEINRNDNNENIDNNNKVKKYNLPSNISINMINFNLYNYVSVSNNEEKIIFLIHLLMNNH